jgi:RNA polymerase sigma-70 factor (ECF subfamily)
MVENILALSQQSRRATQENVAPARPSKFGSCKRAGATSIRRASAAVEAMRKSGTRTRVGTHSDYDVQALLVGTVPNLRAFAISLCGDPTRSDDLVQDTLVKAWTNLASFEKGTNLKAWLLTILRNTYFSHLRKHRREVEDANGAHAERMSVLPGQQVHMDVVDFKKAFGSLNNDQKEILLLVGAEGFSYKEAAEITGTAIGTAKSRVNRARAALTKSLGLRAEENFNSNAEFIGLVHTGQAVGRG